LPEARKAEKGRRLRGFRADSRRFFAEKS
jgi:hypothetical protein